jgi:hypothetical protein
LCELGKYDGIRNLNIYETLRLNTPHVSTVAYHPITGAKITGQCVLVSFNAACEDNKVFDVSQTSGYLHDQIVDWWMAWWACESHGSYEMKV